MALSTTDFEAVDAIAAAMDHAFGVHDESNAEVDAVANAMDAAAGVEEDVDDDIDVAAIAAALNAAAGVEEDDDEVHPDQAAIDAIVAQLDVE